MMSFNIGINISQALFFTQLRRRPNYYLLNLVAPCVILTILEVACIFLPPEEAERSTFAITVLLAFTVLQSQVLANVPRTSQSILLTNYILAQTIFSMVCTIYSTAMCCYANSTENRAHEVITIRNIFYRPKRKIVDHFMPLSTAVIALAAPKTAKKPPTIKPGITIRFCRLLDLGAFGIATIFLVVVNVLVLEIIRYQY